MVASACSRRRPAGAATLWATATGTRAAWPPWTSRSSTTWRGPAARRYRLGRARRPALVRGDCPGLTRTCKEVPAGGISTRSCRDSTRQAPRYPPGLQSASSDWKSGRMCGCCRVLRRSTPANKPAGVWAHTGSTLEELLDAPGVDRPVSALDRRTRRQHPTRRSSWCSSRNSSLITQGGRALVASPPARTVWRPENWRRRRAERASAVIQRTRVVGRRGAGTTEEDAMNPALRARTRRRPGPGTPSGGRIVVGSGPGGRVSLGLICPRGAVGNARPLRRAATMACSQQVEILNLWEAGCPSPFSRPPACLPG